MANEVREAPADGDRLTSVDNALWLLQLVAERQSLRVSEAADLLGVARSTAHRLLSELRRRYPAAELPAPMPAAITSRRELMRELGQVRRQGYALNWEESSEGVAAVAVAIRDVAGMPLASISVSVPSMRLGSIAGIRA